jgi:hypothetical protein
VSATRAGDGGTGDAGLPDIVELLTTDHRRIQQLVSDGDVQLLVAELSSHLVAETQLVYPELRRATDADELVDGCLEGDHVLETALTELDKGHVQALQRVGELLADHCRALEEEVFPRMRSAIDPERLVALGDSLQEVLRTAPRRPHPHNPDEGAFEIIADAISAEVDKLRHRHDH